MMNSNRHKIFYIVLGMFFLFTGCGKNFVRTEEFKVVDVKKAQTAEVIFRALKADLIIGGGANNLMAGKFNYYLSTSRTFVDYHEEAGEGKLLIYDKFNPSIGIYPSEPRFNLWRVALNGTFPLKAMIDLKEGKIAWDSRRINLERLELELGKVTANFDLTKSGSHNFYASVRLAEGNLVFRISDAIGASIELEDENQIIQADGFKREGKILINNSYLKEKPGLRFYIHPSQGNISFESIPVQ